MAHLYENVDVVVLILIFAIVNLLAWSKDGIFLQELEMLQDMHNVRTFHKGDVRYGKLKPILYFQYFFFFGLCLCYIFSDSPIAIFSKFTSFSLEAYAMLAICVLVPLIWFLYQYFSYHWIGFIFGGVSRLVIVDRLNRSMILLAGTFLMALFSTAVVLDFLPVVVAILLTAIFILTQIVFIFSGFKIFFNSFGSLCLFLVYLCTLEIAPLALIVAKIGL